MNNTIGGNVENGLLKSRIRRIGVLGDDDLKIRLKLLHDLETQVEDLPYLLPIFVVEGILLWLHLGIPVSRELRLARLIEEQKSRHWPMVHPEKSVERQIHGEAIA